MGGAGIDQRGNLAPSYFTRFPPALISRELSHEAGRNHLQLSYARRLNRPKFMQLPPLAIYQGPRSYRLGAEYQCQTVPNCNARQGQAMNNLAPP